MQQATETRRLASLETAAAYIDVSVKAIRAYIAQGKLTGYRIGPRIIRVDLNDIDAMLRVIPTGGSAPSA